MRARLLLNQERISLGCIFQQKFTHVPRESGAHHLTNNLAQAKRQTYPHLHQGLSAKKKSPSRPLLQLFCPVAQGRAMSGVSLSLSCLPRRRESNFFRPGFHGGGSLPPSFDHLPARGLGSAPSVRAARSLMLSSSSSFSLSSFPASLGAFFLVNRTSTHTS